MEHALCSSYRYKPFFLSAGLAGRHGTTVAVFSDITHLLEMEEAANCGGLRSVQAVGNG